MFWRVDGLVMLFRREMEDRINALQQLSKALISAAPQFHLFDANLRIKGIEIFTSSVSQAIDYQHTRPATS